MTRMLCFLLGGANSLVRSMWRGKFKFNGFFFAINVLRMRPAAVDEYTLFEPGNVMVQLD